MIGLPAKRGDETTRARVCYLSSGEHGWDMLKFLMGLDCDLVFTSTDDRKPDWAKMPDYDLGLNFLGTRKIPADQVNRPRLGWANFHPAPLPEFGGRNLCYHAVMTGAKEFGATVHYMDEGFDTGDIIACKRFEILPEDTAGDLYRKSVDELKAMFKRLVPGLMKGEYLAMPQDRTKAQYYPKEPINDGIDLTFSQWLRIRALTFHPKHHARVNVGGRWYRIVPEDK